MLRGSLYRNFVIPSHIALRGRGSQALQEDAKGKLQSDIQCTFC